MQIIKISIALVLILASLIYYFGLGLVFETASYKTIVFAIAIIAIHLFSAFARIKKKFLPIYIFGLLFHLKMLIEAAFAMIDKHYFKIFDIAFPSAVMVTFSALIYISIRGSQSK
jgi:hypothetical protein